MRTNRAEDYILNHSPAIHPTVNLFQLVQQFFSLVHGSEKYLTRNHWESVCFVWRLTKNMSLPKGIAVENELNYKKTDPFKMLRPLLY